MLGILIRMLSVKQQVKKAEWNGLRRKGREAMDMESIDTEAF